MFASLVWIALALAEAPSPELQARLDAAEAAWARGDGAEAERLLTAINDEAPAWDKPWRRRCGVVLDDGRSSDAVELCRKALAIEASVENRTALALALVRDATGLEDAGDAALAEARALLDA
ncbi:MAG TPA: hypothetical protein PKA64_26210, partial [Myxococcota bacterium]|nr:hypothetical protein [Myxococcota bacterium]